LNFFSKIESVIAVGNFVSVISAPELLAEGRYGVFPFFANHSVVEE
jgi:hypothetical protein